jgi:LacI family transcriptional regulator
LTLELLQERPVSAIIGMNDMVACGIMKALREKGYEIPQQISVCGFDNIFVSSILTPTLTTIDHCIQHRVKIALDILLESIENRKGNSGVYKIEYDPQLIVRNSTGPCKMNLA